MCYQMCVFKFITAVPITKLFALDEMDGTRRETFYETRRVLWYPSL
jgi:hypothetical protein